MKYIVFTDKRGVETGVVFSDLIDHSTFKSLGATSAGFCDIVNIEYDTNSGKQLFNIATWGRSVSLGLESKQGDDKIIKKGLEFKG